ncbi:MAG: hypothetical protein IPG06_05925 [Haliea sp.]|nr:hypothetical protein [Haliea sp.]
MPSSNASCFVLHAAGHGQQQLIGLVGLRVQLLQVGVHQIARVPRRAEGRLQRVGGELPPVARVDVARLQAGSGARGCAEQVVLALQQRVTRTLYARIAVPQLQVAVIEVEQADTH